MKHLSRKYFERMGEPLGDSVTRKGPDGRMTYGGGGGGGSSNPDTRYANLDQLYGTQNQASQFMLNNAMPYIPNLTENSAGMVDDAMDGTLAKQMSEQAGNNAQSSLGAALDANNRNMQRYGIKFGANRALSEANRNAIMGAGMKVGEMNKATAAAEDMKWNRNANFYGQVMGMNNGAMQGMSSAGAGMNSMNAQQSANDRANAQGYGQAGQAFSNALFKADGGEVKAPKLAKGGDAWAAYKAANPVQVSSGSGSGGGRSSGAGMFIGGAMPALAGNALKDVLNLDGKGGKIVKNIGKVQDWYKNYQNMQQMNESLNQAPDYANGQLDVPDMTGFDSATMEVGGGAASEVGGGAATELGGDVAVNTGTDATVSAGSEVGASVAADFGSNISAGGADMATSYWAADGGYISKKRAQRFAFGGMPSMQKMSVADNGQVAQNDTNKSMSIVNMDDQKKPVNATHSGAGGGNGYTTGMGEGSDNDPDGFGKEGADNRHFMGSAILSYFLPKGTGGIVADVIHPVMEPVTRTLVNTGHSITGNSAGAMMVDPQGTMASGKYSPDTIMQDWATEHGKITAGASVLAGDPITAGIAGKLGGLFADGGEVEPTQRADYTPGGEVRGPGTETSDDIPAWLSDGEYVINADAVKLIGKDKLEAINNKGLEVREKKKLFSGGVPRLAGGGFLGGNLGIALGAGVDQWNKQQAIDLQREQVELQRQASARAERADERTADEFKWKQSDRQNQESLQNKLKEVSQSQTAFDANTARTASDAIGAARDQGVLSPDVEKAVQLNTKQDAAKIRPNFDQEYVNAFRDFGRLDQAATLEKLQRERAAGEQLVNSISDPALKVVAPLSPVDIAKTDAALRGRADAQEARLRQIEMNQRYGAGRGSSSRSSSGNGNSANKDVERGYKLIEDTYHKDASFQGASKESPPVLGPDLRPIANTMYGELLQAGVPVDRAAMQAINLAKAAKGVPGAEYKTDVTINPLTGGYQVQVKNLANEAETTLHKNIGNPTAFMGGDQRALAILRGNAAAEFAQRKGMDVRELANLSNDQIKALAESARKAGKDGNVAEQQLRLFSEHAKEYVKANPAKQEKPASQPSGQFLQGNSEFNGAWDRLTNWATPSGRAAAERKRVLDELNPQ